jgi:short-subunit dehydrogenase
MNNADFAAKYGPWALVAGGSEGIGAAFARQIAAKGLNVLIIARRPGPLEETAAAIRAESGVEVRTASIDLGENDVVNRIAAVSDSLDVGLFVYNACHSFIGNFLDEDDASRLDTLYVNTRGPLLLSGYFSKRFVERRAAKGRKSGLILMSSMAGFQGPSMTLTYAATKAFNTVLGEGLWRELTPHDIDVLVNVAGATLTPGFKRGTPEARWKDAYPSQPEDVAREGLAHLGKGPTHIAGGVNRMVHAIFGRLSRRFAVTFMASNTEKLYN